MASPLAQSVLQHFQEAGLSPPSPGEVARRLAAKPQIVAGLVEHLIEQGALLRLKGDLLIARTAVNDLAQALQETGWTTFTPRDFKAHFHLSSKWAVPLLEQLDADGITRREGEGRVIR